MFKKDTNLLGVLMGIFLPVMFYGFLFLINLLILSIFDLNFIIKQSTLQLISIFINLFPLRYYFVKLKYEKTGRGILLVTFMYLVFYFLVLYD
jgi:hypothetical protein